MTKYNQRKQSRHPPCGRRGCLRSKAQSRWVNGLSRLKRGWARGRGPTNISAYLQFSSVFLLARGYINVLWGIMFLYWYCLRGSRLGNTAITLLNLYV